MPRFNSVHGAVGWWHRDTTKLFVNLLTRQASSGACDYDKAQQDSDHSSESDSHHSDDDVGQHDAEVAEQIPDFIALLGGLHDEQFLEASLSRSECTTGLHHQERVFQQIPPDRLRARVFQQIPPERLWPVIKTQVLEVLETEYIKSG